MSDVLKKLQSETSAKQNFSEEWASDINLVDLSDNEELTISLYARVSTTKDAQVDAVKYQKSVLENWLKKQIEKHSNWKIGEAYVDTKTGRNFKRDAYKRMMLDAQMGKMNYIVFWETSRFGRNLSAVLRECIKLNDNYNVNLYFVDKKIDTRLPDGLGKLSEEAKIADEYSRNTRAKVIRGINEKKRVYESMEDGYLFTHRILGLETRKGEKQHLYRVEDEVETLNLMAKFYLEENSLTKTAERLMEAGRLTMTGSTYWSPSSLSRYLHNPIYVCVEEQNKTKIATMSDYYNNSRTRFTKDNHNFVYMPDRIERIWSDELFLQIQNALEKNKRAWLNSGDMRGEMNDVFTQLLWCKCGGKYNRHSKDVEFGKNTYECHNRKNKGSKKAVELRKGALEEICTMSPVQDWKLRFMLTEIWDHLDLDINKTLGKALSIISEHSQDTGTKGKISEMITELDAKILRLEKLVERHRNRMLHEIITEEEYMEDSRQIKLDIEALQQERDSLLPNLNSCVSIQNEITKQLKEIMGNKKDRLNDEFIFNFIDMIVQVEDNVFHWYLNVGNTDVDDIPEEYRIIHKKLLPLKTIEVIKDSRMLISEFTLDATKARAFKKSQGIGDLKRFNEITVKVLA